MNKCASIIKYYPKLLNFFYISSNPNRWKKIPIYPKRKKERKKRSRSSSKSQSSFGAKWKKKVNNRIIRKEKDRNLCRNCLERAFPGRVPSEPSESAVRDEKLFADLKCRAVALPIPRGKRGRAGNVILSDPKSCRRLIFDSHLLLPSRETSSARRSSFPADLLFCFFSLPLSSPIKLSIRCNIPSERGWFEMKITLSLKG